MHSPSSREPRGLRDQAMPGHNRPLLFWVVTVAAGCAVNKSTILFLFLQLHSVPCLSDPEIYSPSPTLKQSPPNPEPTHSTTSLLLAHGDSWQTWQPCILAGPCLSWCGSRSEILKTRFQAKLSTNVRGWNQLKPWLHIKHTPESFDGPPL